MIINCETSIELHSVVVIYGVGRVDHFRGFPKDLSQFDPEGIRSLRKITIRPKFVLSALLKNDILRLGVALISAVVAAAAPVAWLVPGPSWASPPTGCCVVQSPKLEHSPPHFEPPPARQAAPAPRARVPRTGGQAWQAPGPARSSR